MKKLIATLAITAFAVGFAASANAARTISKSTTIVNTSSGNRVAYTGPVSAVVIGARPNAGRHFRSRGFLRRNYRPIRHRFHFIPRP